MPVVSPANLSVSVPPASVAFASVKLPGSFVQEAKLAAAAMRRSTAGQIEYWALLGKAVEEGGLTVKEAAAALSAPAPAASAADVVTAADAWLADYVQLDASGGLARHVRQAIALNAAQAALVPEPQLSTQET